MADKTGNVTLSIQRQHGSVDAYDHIVVEHTKDTVQFHQCERILSVISLEEITDSESLESEVLFDLLNNSMLDDVIAEMQVELVEIARDMIRHKLTDHALRQLNDLKQTF